MMPDPAGEDEEEIGEAGQGSGRAPAAARAGSGREPAAPRPPAHGAGEVERRAHPPAAGEDERAQRREVLLAAVDRALEGLHLRLADAEHARAEGLRRRGELATQVEELVLEPAQDLVELATRGRPVALGPVHGAGGADRPVQL